MFDAATGLLVKTLAAPLRTHDLAQFADLHPQLKPGDVLVADTAFASYVHLALLWAAKLHGLFPTHQRTLVSFRQDRRLVGKRPKGTGPGRQQPTDSLRSAASTSSSVSQVRRLSRLDAGRAPPPARHAPGASRGIDCSAAGTRGDGHRVVGRKPMA
jgi:hypothetical protein